MRGQMACEPGKFSRGGCASSPRPGICRQYAWNAREWRTFKLTRMSSLHLTGECFPETLVPPPIEPASGGPTECEVTLRFPADAAFRVYDEFSGESIRIGQDGSFTVTARMPLGDGWLYSYLLSFGGTAEVLSPLHVRRGLAQFARMACQRYEKDVPGSIKPDGGCQV